MATYTGTHGTGIHLGTGGQNPATIGTAGTAGYITNVTGGSYSGAAIFVNGAYPWNISVNSNGTVVGAAGSAGVAGPASTASGGMGGLGINLTVAGSVSNSGTIKGGNGGKGFGNEGPSFHGGAGGAGIAAATSATITNTSGEIMGGAGGGVGLAFVNGAAGGAGGAGITVAGSLTLTNAATIAGGAGAAGGNVLDANGGTGGAGGTGVIAGALSTISNTGTILGGVGGAGGDIGQPPNYYHGPYGAGGAGGAGLILTNGGYLTNSGNIIGGIGGGGGNGFPRGTDGAGISITAGTGFITNASAGTIAGGIGVVVSGAGGSINVKNYGLIKSLYGTTGTAVNFTNLSDNTLTLEAGSTLIGTATGGGGSLLLDSAGGAGTLAGGLGSTIVDFRAYEVFGTWTLSGTNTVNNPTELLTSFGTLVVAGSLTNQGVVSGALTLSSGAYLSNIAGHSISGGGNAVVGVAGPSMVVNAGTIRAAASGSNAVYLNAGGVVSNTNGALVYGYANGIYATTVPATVVNTGTISGHSSAGVWLNSGGSVTNLAGGFIQGKYKGVYGDQTAITVTNSGTIAGSDPNEGTGIEIKRGGVVTNAAGALISGAVGLHDAYFTLSLTNYGTIIGTGTIGGAGIDFNSAGGRVVNGGTVTGGGSALIQGTIGIHLHAGAGNTTIVNYGTIASLLGTTGNAVVFDSTDVLILEGGSHIVGKVVAGGSSQLNLVSATSAGTISGLGSQYTGFTQYNVLSGANWTLSGSNIISVGTTLTDLGTLTNAGTLTIAGSFVVDPAPFVNSGSISGTTILGSGSQLSNTSTGVITAGGTAVYGYGGPTSLTNFGIISAGADAFNAKSAGFVVNASGAITAGHAAINLQGGGTITNSAGGILLGSAFGVVVNNTAATVINFGTITGSGGLSIPRGVVLYTDGSVTNANGGLIQGLDGGVAVAFGVATVSNQGTILGGAGGGAVYLGLGGVISNSGLIEAAGGIQVFQSAGILLNAGTIIGTSSYGVGLTNGGYVSVANTGAITGVGKAVYIQGTTGTVVNFGTLTGTGAAGVGVNLLAGGTVINAGTISGAGGTAVTFGAAGLLTIDGGSVLDGKAVGHGGTLNFAGGTGPGTASGLGSQYINFNQYVVAAGASWTFNSTDMLSNGATFINSGTVIGNGLVLNNGANTAINQGVIEGVNAVTVGGAVNNSGGTIAALGSNITVSGATIAGGTFFTSNGQIVIEGTSLLDGSASALINSGSVLVADQQVLDIDGTLINIGSINTNVVGHVTEVVVTGSSVTLTGGGTLSLNDTNDAIIMAPAPGHTLDNVNNTIAGPGQLGNGTALNIVNEAGGVIDGNSNSGPLTINTGAATVVNKGTLEATGGGQLTIDSAVNNSGGTIAAIGGNVNLSNAVIAGGTLVGGSGQIVIEGTSLLDGSASALTNSASVLVADQQILDIAGTLVNIGSINTNVVGHVTEVVVTGSSVTLTGGGTLTLNDTNDAIVMTSAPGHTLDNINNTIKGLGQLGNGTALNIINETGGVINGNNNSGPLTINTGTATVVNKGTLEATGGGQLTIASAVNNSGGTIAAIGGSTVVLSNAIIAGGTLTANSAQIVISGTSTLDGSVSPLTNSASVVVADQQVLDVAGTLINIGSINTNVVGHVTEVVVTGSSATLTGGGTLSLNDSNDAIVMTSAPGHTLDNVNNTIAGWGQLGNGTALNIVNEALGVINGNNNSGPLTINIGAATVVNKGLIEATGGGQLTIDGAVNNSGGRIAAIGGNVNLSNAVIAGGTLVGGSDQIIVSGTSTLDGSTSVLTNSANVVVQDLQVLDISGTLVNIGSINTNVTGHSAEVVVTGSSVTLTGGGTLSLNDSNVAIVMTSAPGHTLDNVNNTIAGPGQLGDGTTLNIINEAGGVINGNNNSGPLTINTGVATVVNKGLLEATGGGQLVIDSAVNNSGGTIAAIGGSVILSGVTVSGGKLMTANGQQIVVNGASTFDGSISPITNAGNLQINGQLSVLGTLANFGTITGGATPFSFGTTNGVLLVEGSSTINGTVNGNGGTLELAAGNGSGTLSGLGSRYVSFAQYAVVAGGTWTLSGSNTLLNHATLTNDGTLLIAGNLVIDPSTMVNSGYMSGSVTLTSGSYLLNTATGTLTAAATAVYGIGGAVSVTNSGLIQSTGTVGVDLRAGGIVTNAGTGRIFGNQEGVVLENTSGTVVNFGTISATAATGAVAGAALLAGGTVINSGGVISATATLAGGLYIKGGGRVDNSGTISAAGGPGVSLISGNQYVINRAGSLIQGGGGNQGVFIAFPGFSTIVNHGTIQGSGAAAIYIGYYGRVINGQAGVAGGLITSDGNGLNVGIRSGAATVTNYGSIIVTGTGGAGVILNHGGYLRNGATNATSATIAAPYAGVRLRVSTSTVVNYGTILGGKYGVLGQDTGHIINNFGTISANGGSGTAVFLAAGGLVTNHANAVIGYSSTINVLITGGTGTVINQGTIAGVGFGSDAVSLLAGGSVVNSGTLSVISGGDAGVRIATVAGTLDNFGQIAASFGVLMNAGGLLVNGDTNTPTATITGVGGGSRAILGQYVPTTILNFGTATGEIGIYLRAGGTVVNKAGALAQGANGPGVYFGAATGTLFNYGSIGNAAPTGAAVAFKAGGSVLNQGTITGGNYALKISGAAGTLSNTGLLKNTARFYPAIDFLAGGTIANQTGGTIQGGLYIHGGGGGVTNSGTIAATIDPSNIAAALGTGGEIDNGSTAATGALMAGMHVGAQIKGGIGTVLNFGTISAAAANGAGVYLAAGGNVTNAASGVISAGAQGIEIAGGVGYVLNRGIIDHTGTNGHGIELMSGGSVSNAQTGFIVGAYNGVRIYGAAGTVTNLGTIETTFTAAAGVNLNAGGVINNGQAGVTTALITGSIDGAQGYTAAATVSNFGTISGVGRYGVYLKAGGSVSNHAVITGGQAGVKVNGGAGTVENYGTIQGIGTAGDGIKLQNGGIVSNAGTGVIAGISTGIQVNGAAGQVVNYGRIAGTADRGIYFGFGGTIVNGATGSTGASIAGYNEGIRTEDAAATVINFGSITASGSAGDGVALLAGGAVTNKAGGYIQGTAFGVYISQAIGMLVNSGIIAAGTYSNPDAVRLHDGGIVLNSGTISGANTSATGVNLYSGGTLVNSAGALIQAGHIGVEVTGATATAYVSNFGTIIGGDDTGVGMFAGTQTLVNSGVISATGTSASGIYAVGGSFTNAATGIITAAGRGIGIGQSAGTIFNGGMIAGTGTGGYGVSLFGGLLFNSAGALISGGNNAVNLDQNGTVVNGGGIESVSESGVRLFNGGSLLNSGRITGLVGVYLNGTAGTSDTVTNTGLIIGVNQGVQMRAAAQTVVNSGVISATATNGAGIYGVGGTVINAATGLISAGASGVNMGHTAGTIINLGTIEGSPLNGLGAVLVGGLLVNSANALISGGQDGADFSAFGTGVNGGRILGGADYGMLFFSGGLVNNSGLISGLDGVQLRGTGGASQVTNTGTIAGVNHGVKLQIAAATVVNSGLISASDPNGIGLYSTSGGNVTNAGTGLIVGGGLGLGVDGAGATVVNLGTIESTGANSQAAIYLAAGSTLTNAGTIIGARSTAILFHGQNNRLILDPGEVISGQVGNGASTGITLELAPGGTGTFGGGLGTNYFGFDKLVVDPNATWVLTGANTLAGTASIGIAATLIDYGNPLSLSGSVINQGLIKVARGGQVQIAGSVSNSGGTIDVLSGSVLLSGASVAGGTLIALNAGNAINALGTDTFDGTVSALTNSGVVVVGAGNELDLRGSIVNAGQIIVSNNLGNANLFAVGSTVSLSGSGTIQLGDTTRTNSATIAGANGGALDNIDNTIDGFGQLGNGTAFLVTNELHGVINANSAQNGGLVINTGSIALANRGLVEATVGGLLTLSSNVNNFGGTIAGNGGTVTIAAGATAAGFGQFSGPILNQGVIDAIGGTLEIVGTITGGGSERVESGSTLWLTNAAAVPGGISFNGSGGTLRIDGTVMPSNTIGGFTVGDTIDLSGLGNTASTSAVYHNGTLTVTNGTVTDTLVLSGVGTQTHFTTTSDGHGGTNIMPMPGGNVFSGTYTSGIVLSNATVQNPATVTAGGVVRNATAAYGRDAVYGTNAAAWTLSNYGTIDAAQTGASGVYFAAGGTVNNNGAVSGVYVGVNIHGAAGVVTNTGTVTGTTSYAVALRSGGLVSNSGRLQALTTNSSVAAVVVQGSAGTVLNIGTIAAPSGGLAVWLQAGGYIDNGGTAAPTALLQGGGYGVLVQNAAGTVFNNGTIVATSNNSIGVSLSRGGTVGNSGTILGGVGVNVRGGGGTVSNTGLIQGTGTSGTGVYLQQGGVIVNSSLITGYRTGVSGQGAAVTLVNNGNVRNTATFGAAVSLGGGGLVRNNAVILGGGNGIVILGATGTVINAGQIGVVNTAGGYGVALLSGGYVYNAAGRQIAAGVYFGQSFGPGLPSTLINAGTVSKTNGIAVNLGTAGGLVVNEGSAALISGSRIGVALLPGTGIATGAVTIDNSGLITGPVAIQTSATTFIDNFGTIAATATAVNATGIAIGGGIVTNEAGGLIDGASGNAVTTNTAGVGMTLVNLGTVRNAATSASTVYLGHGGAVINGASGAQSALLSGSRNVVSFASVTGFAGTVDNFGTILSTGVTAGNGIYMGHGGLVTNRAGALITSPRNGVNIQNAAGTLINFGTVAHTGTGTQGDAVQLGAGGTVVNYGLLTGGHVSIYGAPNTIGSVVNIQGQPGTVRNLGTILATSTDSHGVELLDGGTLINGATNNSSALIEAGRRGVYIGGTFGIPTAGALGLVFNYGTIANTNTTAAAIEFTAGGTLTNYGLILSPRTGVNFSDSAGTVINNGLIASTAPLTATGGSGIYLQIGGQITNQAGGVVSAVRAAISIGNTTTTAGSVTIANAGSLIGATGIAIGAYDSGAANIVNTGAITGTSGSGIRFGTGPSTLTNAGTIIGGGGTAVAFAGGGRLIVDPGAVFSGAVLGGAGGSTLELAGTAPGTLSGVGGSISGFGQITVDSGAAWSLAGGTTLAVGGTLSDFGSLAITGSLVDGGTIQIEGTAGLILANGATGGGVIAFVGSGGRLEIDGSVMPTLPVNGFGAGDTIDLPGLGFSGVAPVLQGTTLILTGTGGVSDTLTLTGLVAHTQLSTANDGHGGTVLKGTTVPGLITGTYTNGLSLSNPAQNPATLTNNALVTYGGAGYARALYARSGTAMWTITNDGTVIGNPTGYVTGIGLGSPGIVINGAPGITNALIAGGQNGISTGAGAQSGPSTVVNYGTIASTGSNGGVGVQLGHGGLLVNDGLISAGHYAVYIGGNRGTHYAGATGTVINDGTMLGGKYTVVALQAGGTVENYGTIAATNTAVRGIQLLAGGSIVNHGVIAGSATGIYATSATGRVTIANYGTIVGANGTAVSLGSGQETLILGLGSVLLGSAGSAGIVKGLLAGDVLDFRGIAGATASVGANNLLSVSGGGVSATLQLDPTQNFTSDTFAAVADGAGGTALTLNVPGTVGFGQTLVVSGLVSGITVLSGGTLEVASGGTVVNTVVTNGGLEIVDAGGTDLSGTLQSGGSEDVFGSAFNTLLIKGGSMTVEAGGFTQAVVLDDAAVQSVSGLAIGTVVSVSDSQSVASGGLASNSVISGGSVIVTSGGNARGAVLVTGSETISAGGIDVGATLSGGTQDVFGRAEGALVKAGASQIVEAGGSTSATVLGGAASRFNAVQDFSIANGNPNGVWSYTASGALLTQPTPGSVFGQSGTNYWFNGQSQPQAVVIGQNTTGSTQTYASRVVPTDQLVLDPQGVADASVSFKAPTTGTYQISGDFTGLDTQEHAHPVEIRLNGTDVFSNTIASFGQTDAFNLTLSLNAGDILAFAVDTGPNGDFRDLSTGLNVTIATGLAAGSGGSQDVRSNGTASGTVVGNGGTEIVEAGGITSNTVIAGGLVDLQSGSRASGSILFTAAGGVLVVDSTTGPAAVISGLSRSATIDLRGITSASGDTVAFNSNAQTVTVTSGGVSEVLQVAGVAAGTAFRLGDDGAGGVLLHEVPPAPAGLGLISASDSGIVGDDITNVSTPTVSGTGEAGIAGGAGDTVTLLAGSTIVASATVQANGTWSATTSSLADGTYQLSAFETDAQGNASALSAPLAVTIDTVPPSTVADILTVLASAGATPLRIVAPSDGANPAGALSIKLTGLPSNGTVTLADGTTPVTAGESLSVAQLTGLDFTPASSATGTTSALTYTVADPAGNTASGAATIGVASATNPTSLYDFVFTYNDGKDYYLGAVADDGSHVQVGETLTTGLGTYTVFANAGVTALPVGTVSVSTYSHNGIGEGSPVPLKTAQGQPDGTAGLGSEADAVSGTDGLPHAFSPTQEASFTTTALYGFVFTYADNKEFYTGTVADDGSFGTTVGTRNITNGAGQLVGNYTVFAEGVTTRVSGSVTVDRFSAGDASLVPSAVSGSAGLGSESGTLTINGAATSFSPIAEPALSIAFQPVTPTAPPSQQTVIQNEVTVLYSEVLGRSPPDASGLATFSTAIANGMSLAAVRQTLANSPEAQNHLNQLYLQTFDRVADTGGLATYTQLLANGETMEAVQAILGTSAEAQTDINQLYLSVLARAADPGGLATYTGVLATGFADLDGVRSILAHSPEAISDLTSLFQSDIGRAPSAAELFGMEDQLGASTGNGASQTTIDAALKANGNAGGFTTITPPTGSASLTAAPNTPTLFAFDNIAFGQDTIAGFDPARDTLEISSALAANLATIKTDTTSANGNTIITLNTNQSITLNGVSPSNLSNPNFIFK